MLTSSTPANPSLLPLTYVLKSNQSSLNKATHTLHDHLDYLKRLPSLQLNNNPNTQKQTLDTNDIKLKISKIIPTIDTARRAIITYFDNDRNKIKEAIDKLTPAPQPIQQDLKETIELAKTSTHELIEHSKLMKPNPTPNEGPCPMYSSVLKSSSLPTITTHTNTPTQTTPAIAHAAVWERQILIQPTGLGPILNPSHTTESIALRVETAINALDNPDNVEIEVKAILRLVSGSLLVELNTKEATDWICTDGVRDQLITYLNIQGTIKDRQYPILVPFLPIRHDITNKDWIELIEKDNKIHTGSILGIRWAKPIEKQSENQCVDFFLGNKQRTLTRMLSRQLLLPPRIEH